MNIALLMSCSFTDFFSYKICPIYILPTRSTSITLMDNKNKSHACNTRSEEVKIAEEFSDRKKGPAYPVKFDRPGINIRYDKYNRITIVARSFVYPKTGDLTDRNGRR